MDLQHQATTAVLRVVEEARAHAIVEAANAQLPYDTFVREEGLGRARTAAVADHEHLWSGTSPTASSFST